MKKGTKDTLILAAILVVIVGLIYSIHACYTAKDEVVNIGTRVNSDMIIVVDNAIDKPEAEFKEFIENFVKEVKKRRGWDVDSIKYIIHQHFDGIEKIRAAIIFFKE